MSSASDHRNHRQDRQSHSQQPEEDWFWGNHRGGGGAPVKTVTGEQVSNLRHVAHGNVVVDQLSPSARRQRGHPDRSFHDANDRDLPRSSADSRISVDHRPGDNNGLPLNQKTRVIPDSSYVSPSHRGARKNMFLSDSDREEKARKAREFQESLREQVEEKKRQKEQVDREKKQQQQREYDEYMSHHYKGAPPGSFHSPSNGHAARDVQNPRREQPTPPRARYDQGSPPPRNERREQQTPPRQNRRGQADRGSPRRGGVISPIRREENAHNRRERNSEGSDEVYRRQGGHGSNYSNENGRGGDWVSKVEYDELSSLCKDLLKKQQVLEEQLEQQSCLIQELQSGSATAPSNEAALGQKRSFKNRRGPVDSKKQSDNNTKNPPPKSIAARQSAALAAAEKKKLPKVQVGFGSRIDSEKDKERRKKRERFAENAMRSQSVRSERLGKPTSSPRPRSTVENESGREVTQMKSNVKRTNNSGAAPSAPGGFKKLQAMASNGPKVVTYEEELPAIGPDKFRQSKGELQGASDLLYINGKDVDRISEDQLDKLLGKARGVRSSD